MSGFKYAIIPTEILLRPDIPWKMKGRYGILLGRALNKPFIDLTKEEIAELWSQAEEDGPISLEGVRAYLAKMEEAGLVERERRRRHLRLHLKVRYVSDSNAALESGKSDPNVALESGKSDPNVTLESGRSDSNARVGVNNNNISFDDDDQDQDQQRQDNNYYSAEIFEKLTGVPDFLADKAHLLAADPWVTVDRIERWLSRLESDQEINKLPAVLFLNLYRHREPPEPSPEPESGKGSAIPRDPLTHAYQCARRQTQAAEAHALPTAPGPEYGELSAMHAQALGIPLPQGREGQEWARLYQEIVKKVGNTYDLADPGRAFSLVKMALEKLAARRGTKDGNFWWGVWSSPRSKSLTEKLIEQVGKILRGQQRQAGIVQASRSEDAPRQDGVQEVPPVSEEEELWQTALDELQLQMTKATFDTWVRDARIMSRENGTFVIGVRTAYAKDWLENRLLKTVQRTLSGLVGGDVEVKFEVMTLKGEKA